MDPTANTTLKHTGRRAVVRVILVELELTLSVSRSRSRGHSHSLGLTLSLNCSNPKPTPKRKPNYVLSLARLLDPATPSPSLSLSAASGVATRISPPLS